MSLRRILGRPAAALAATAAALLLSGCAGVDDYNKAKAENTLLGWQEFVRKYPMKERPNCGNCAAADKAYKEALARDKSEFDAAASSGTAEAYMSFVASHQPGTPHFAQAQDRLMDGFEKGTAREEDYIAYLEQHPFSEANVEVRRSLMQLRYRRAHAADSEQRCELFLAQYPGTPEAARLKPRCEGLAFGSVKRLGSRMAAEFFLKRFPESTHAKAVAAMLADLPRSSPTGSLPNPLGVVAKIRDSSPELRADECLGWLSSTVGAAGDPMSPAAERVRSELVGAWKQGNVPVCGRGRWRVPDSDKAVLSAAVRALAEVHQRQARLSSVFEQAEALADKARGIGKTSSEMSEKAEAFDLEMQAYYGYMPADPDNPHQKATADAQEAERRARAAFELLHSQTFKERKIRAAEVLRLMDDEESLLTRVIAYYEKPASEAAR